MAEETTQQELLETKSPEFIESAIKSYIYLKRFQELDNLLKNYNLGVSPIMGSMIILRETFPYKNLLPSRDIFVANIKIALRERSSGFEQLIAKYS